MKDPALALSGRYMNARQIAWFRAQLARRLEECERRLTSPEVQTERDAGGDECDAADAGVEAVRTIGVADVVRHQAAEIRAALRRIESGEYGYCEASGDEIGLERLKAVPWARFSVEAQARKEQVNRLMGRG